MASKTQFVGAAGQYLVAQGLSSRQIIASITTGNTSSVDILAASCDGTRSMAIQVKTSRNAYRGNKYGHEGYEWDVGARVIGKHSPSFLYAFVNLREAEGSPEVFFVPSRWVANFVKPDWSRHMYFLPMRATALTRERWDLVQGYLAGDPQAIAWANDWPRHVLVPWVPEVWSFADAVSAVAVRACNPFAPALE
jgi:hypothetical protein